MKPRTITADHSAIEIKVHFQFQKNILYYQLLPSGFLIGDTGTPPSYESQTIIINLQLQKILTIILEFWLSHFYFIIYTSVCFPQLNSFFFFLPWWNDMERECRNSELNELMLNELCC